MDQNKLKVLQDIGYTIPKTCGLCEHGRFAASQDFGVCAIQTYDHLKHSGPARSLSINIAGSCPKFKIDEDAKSRLGAWAEFVK